MLIFFFFAGLPLVNCSGNVTENTVQKCSFGSSSNLDLPFAAAVDVIKFLRGS